MLFLIGKPDDTSSFSSTVEDLNLDKSIGVMKHCN
jgi:hypothetical protein